MRLDAPALVLLSQTARDNIDGLARAPWWFFAFLVLIGGTAGAAKLWSFCGEVLRDKREAAKALAADEKARRDTLNKAEVEQREALTAMARDVPQQFRQVTDAMREANDLMRKELAENTRAVNTFAAAWNDEKRVLLAAIANKLGVQTIDEATRRASRPDHEQKTQPA